MSDGKEKPEENQAGAAPTPPEVDAEIVTEETLTDDDDKKQTAETEAGETSEASAPAKRKSTLTPGVILFIIFAVTALVIFAAWRFQFGPATVDAGSDSDAALAEDVSVEEASDEAVSKIANESVNSTKPADLSEVARSASIGTSALPQGEAKDGIEDGNLGLQEAAKEAFMSASEEVQDNSSGSGDAAPAFEFERAGDADEAEAFDLQSGSASLAESEESVSSVEAVTQNNIDTDDSVAVLDASEPKAADEAASETAAAGEAVSPSTNNDVDASTAQTEELQAKIAALELTLSEERARNVRQREEIGTMRRQFEEALAERDRAAGARIADLAARLDKIENGGTVEAGRRASAALALGALRRVTDSGAPFAAELDVLAAYVPEGRDMATLRRYADTPVSSAKQLADEFAPVARDAIAAAHRDAAKNPWQKLGARFGNLISVRPAAPIAGDSVEAIVSRAEAQIEAGAVGAGVTELETLPGPAREAMSTWMQQAASRVAVDQAITSLSGRLAPAVR